MKSLRLALLPFSFLFWLGTLVRNWLFDIGLLHTTKLDVPVISVGNISAGGTGKTPFVGVVVQKLKARRKNPAVVSRGYGRTTSGYLLVSDGKGSIAGVREAGDEPVQLAEDLRNTAVVVDEVRVRGSRNVLKSTSSDSVVLDDGFQHRYLHRDLDIVLLTAKDILSGDWLLPAGNRRESMDSLKRADAVVVSKCRDVEQFEESRRRLQNRNVNNTAGFRLVPNLLRHAADGKLVDRESARGTRVMTVAGLGDPESFKQSVGEFGCETLNSVDFPDHHWYSAADLARLSEEFVRVKPAMVVTTRKDLVRLRSLGKTCEEFIRSVSLHVLEVRVEFIGGEDIIDHMLEGVFS